MKILNCFLNISDNNMNLDKYNDDDLIDLYPKLLDQLKTRGIIRTRNIIGELGEYIAKREYKNNPKLPELQLNLSSTKNIDATSIKGERYAIKSTSTKITGVFPSIPTEDDGVVYFEYLILVIFKKDYSLSEIYELTWKEFLRFRKMKPPENKFNLPVTNELKQTARKII